MAEVFANPLAELAEYTDMKQDMDKGKGPIQVSGVTVVCLLLLFMIKIVKNYF